MGLSMCLPLSGVTGPDTIDYPLVLTSPPPTHLGSCAASAVAVRDLRSGTVRGSEGESGRLIGRVDRGVRHID